MTIRAVFAKMDASVAMPGGYPLYVRAGSHWSDQDAVVKLQPGLFTSDPRYGLSWSGEPPAEMAIPPDEDDLMDVPLIEQASAAPGERRAQRR